MGYGSTLRIDGTTYQIRKCSYSFKQKVDQNGQLTSDEPCYYIQLDVISRYDYDEPNKLLEWMYGPVAEKSGTIEIPDRNVRDRCRVIKFEDAILTSYVEKFDAASKKALFDTIQISPSIMSIKDVTW